MNRILSLFVLFAFFAVNSLFAATPTVTVTLSEFTPEHSGAGYVVRLSPVTGGTARRELTDSDGVASFSAVTPAIYSLSIENAGVPTLQIRVPNTADTTAASAIVISNWTPPDTGTITSGIWENAAGTIQPSANGQNRNTLKFTSGAAADADNVGLLVDTQEAWPTGSLAKFQQNGTTVFDFFDAGRFRINSTSAANVDGIATIDGVNDLFFDLWADATDVYFDMGSLANGTDLVFLQPTITSGTAYTFNTSHQLTNSDYLVTFANTNTVQFSVGHGGAVTAAGAVTATGALTGANLITAAGYVSAGTTNRWKTGDVVTGATVALNLTNYVSITINGNVYKLGLVQ